MDHGSALDSELVATYYTKPEASSVLVSAQSLER